MDGECWYFDSAADGFIKAVVFDRGWVVLGITRLDRWSVAGLFTMRSSGFVQFYRHFNVALLRQVAIKSSQQRLPGLSAEIAYHNLLALFPLVLGIFAILGTLKIPPRMVNLLTQQVLQVAPQEVLFLIREFVYQIQLPAAGQATLLSIVAALWLASGALGVAMRAMDQIYKTPVVWIRPFWRTRLVAIALTFGTITLVLIASFLAFISDWLLKLGEFLLGEKLFDLPVFLQIVRWLIAIATLSASSCLLYRYGPSRWRPGTPLLPGALISALLWLGISQLFRLYVALFANYSLAYGSLGAGIVLLIWLHLSSLVVLIGAQLNVTVAEASRSRWWR